MNALFDHPHGIIVKYPITKITLKKGSNHVHNFQDFRTFIQQVSAKRGSPIVPPSILESIYKFLPSLQAFNEDLMRDLYARVKHWEKVSEGSRFKVSKFIAQMTESRNSSNEN